MMNAPFADPASTETRGRKDIDCDHCRTQRNRVYLYILRDRKTGQEIQIGRSCLRDYLGTDNAEGLAQRFVETFKFQGEVEDQDTFGSAFGSRTDAYSILSVLTLAAAFARVDGWVSLAKAEQSEKRATADRVRNALVNWTSAEIKVEDNDAARARTVRDFIRSEDFQGTSDYAQNMKALFDSEGHPLAPHRASSLGNRLLPALPVPASRAEGPGGFHLPRNDRRAVNRPGSSHLQELV